MNSRRIDALEQAFNMTDNPAHRYRGWHDWEPFCMTQGDYEAMRDRGYAQHRSIAEQIVAEFAISMGRPDLTDWCADMALWMWGEDGPPERGEVRIRWVGNRWEHI